MTGEIQENSPGEQEKTGKIAHCLNCSNEWVPRNTAAKKRKCPICGKYRVVWKDELMEKSGENELNSGEIQEISGENTGENEEKKENFEEKTEEKLEESINNEFLLNSPGEIEEKNEEEKLSEVMKQSGGFPLIGVYAVVLGVGILAVAGWFLSGRGKRKRSKNIESSETKKELDPLFNQIQKANARRIY
jgi:predicted RNA-binding Zn-ribbon protein involved in translation (DUF1610 family)